MNIAPIFSYKNSFILNFCSNINFRPVRTKEDAKIAAELYAHMSTFNPHKPLAKFLQNANHNYCDKTRQKSKEIPSESYAKHRKQPFKKITVPACQYADCVFDVLHGQKVLLFRA